MGMQSVAPARSVRQRRHVGGFASPALLRWRTPDPSGQPCGYPDGVRCPFSYQCLDDWIYCGPDGSEPVCTGICIEVFRLELWSWQNLT